MDNKDLFADKLRGEYRKQAEIAEINVKKYLLEWVDKGYLLDEDIADLAKYSRDLKEEILYLTGE